MGLLTEILLLVIGCQIPEEIFKKLTEDLFSIMITKNNAVKIQKLLFPNLVITKKSKRCLPNISISTILLLQEYQVHLSYQKMKLLELSQKDLSLDNFNYDNYYTNLCFNILITRFV